MRWAVAGGWMSFRGSAPDVLTGPVRQRLDADRNARRGEMERLMATCIPNMVELLNQVPWVRRVRSAAAAMSIVVLGLQMFYESGDNFEVFYGR
jgi:hypothetical protein